MSAENHVLINAVDAQRLGVKDGDSVLAAFPDAGIRASYTLSYPGIGAQYVSGVVDEAFFMGQIAPARTFCSEAEALELIKRGLGKGANYDNTLVMGKDGPIKNTLRFPDEPARHKSSTLSATSIWRVWR